MSQSSAAKVTVVGGGIAGAEAAWQAAQAGAEVILCEMRPGISTSIHQTGQYAEIVGSNSLGSPTATKANGLLQQELRGLGSVVMDCADATALTTKHQLIVDRKQMATEVTEALASQPRIELRQQHVTKLRQARPLIIATGPLTTQPLARALYRRLRQPFRFFYQSSEPLISLSEIGNRGLVVGSPYDPEDDTGFNCLLDEAAFEAFCIAVERAESTISPAHNPEEIVDRCLPFEMMAQRDSSLLRRGPMNPARLVDPSSGERPAAIVRLMPEDAQGNLWRLLGLRTGLLPGEQERLFRMLPGLEGLEIIIPGQTVRSVFLNAPAVLAPTGRVPRCEGLFMAGHLIGTTDYLQAAVTGWLAGVNAARWAQGQRPVLLPSGTMVGGLISRLTNSNEQCYQAQPVNFGMLPPPPDSEDLSKEARRQLQVEQSQVAIQRLKQQLTSA